MRELHAMSWPVSSSRVAVRQLSQTWKLRHYDVIDDIITCFTWSSNSEPFGFVLLVSYRLVNVPSQPANNVTALKWIILGTVQSLRKASAMQKPAPVTLGGCAPLGEGELGSHLTQCGQGWGIPACQVSSWYVQPFGHNTHVLQTTDRQTDRQTDDISWQQPKVALQRSAKNYDKNES